MIRPPPRSTPFPTRRSSDLAAADSRVAIVGMKQLRDQVDASIVAERLIANLSAMFGLLALALAAVDRKSTRLNSSHLVISYAVFCLKKKSSQPSAGTIDEAI